MTAVDLTDRLTAVETRYAGHLFRSRLEARWAALFDLVGWQWTYEPFDLTGYLPDFLIANPRHARRPLLVEIKAQPAEAHARRIVAAGWTGSFAVLGAAPTLDGDGAYALGEIDNVGYDLPFGQDDPVCWSSPDAVLVRCACGVGLSSREQSYRCRRCDHYDGHSHPLGLAAFNALWGQAHERTRWVPFGRLPGRTAAP